jgi:hypothetical protein
MDSSQIVASASASILGAIDLLSQGVAISQPERSRSALVARLIAVLAMRHGRGVCGR